MILETPEGLDLYEEMQKFYDEFYSAGPGKSVSGLFWLRVQGLGSSRV